MKRILMLALGAGLAFPAGAQTAPAKAPVKAAATAPKPEAAMPGHAHDHDHEGEAKPTGKETTSDYLWRKSDQAFHDGDYQRAVSLHKAIVAYDPTDIESYSVAAWLLWSMGKGADAMAFLQRGITANPKDPEMWDAAGQHYELQKEFGLAKVAFGKAVEFAGKDAGQMMRRRLAHANEKAGDLPGSILTWQALVRDYPTDAVNKNNLARVEALQAGKNTPVATAAAVGGAVLASLYAVLRRQNLPSA